MARKVSKRTKAVKAEDEQLRDYEMVLVFSPDVVEDRLDTAMSKVSQFITERGGTISEVEQWGKSKLAYPIKRSVEGSYVLTRFKFAPKFTGEFESNLQISEEVLRHLLIKVGS